MILPIRTDCWRPYHRRRHGRRWDGSQCPRCSERWTTPWLTPRMCWRLWRWNVHHR